MIEAAYMTGILPVKKYGTQSALTDFREYTMASPRNLARYVGFTEEEVLSLCEKYHIYCAPVKFAVQPDCKPPAKYFPGNTTVNPGGLQYRLQRGKTLVRRLLLSSDKVHIQPQFCDVICAVTMGRHQEVARLILNSARLLQDTLNMDNEAVAAAIEDAHNAGTAPLFYNNEQALRSVIRFAYISCIDEFLQIEELPSGTGYADVVFLPKKGSAMPIMIIELKWNKSAKSAIDQIRKRQYPQILEGFGSDILLVGISYNIRNKRHSCRIERHRKV